VFKNEKKYFYWELDNERWYKVFPYK